MTKTAQNITSKQMVILHGNPADPEVQQSKQRIEHTGRTVQIQPEQTPPICGDSNCQCTTPCKSFHFKQQ